MLLEGRYDPERARTVPWAIGAVLLVRRQAFDAVGRFDERQWMYAEDLDLGWRLRDARWVLRYEPARAGPARRRGVDGPGVRRQPSAPVHARDLRGDRAPPGPAVARITAAINVAGAAGRVAWMTPPAVLSRRWRARRRETAAWVTAHREGLRRSPGAKDMRRFWNDRAREDAFYFVDTRQPYKATEPGRFWDAEQLVDYVLDGLGVTVGAGDTVVEIGCGLGRITRVLAARARSVMALDVSDEMLAQARVHNPDLGNVGWVLGDGRSLAPVADASVDACVSIVVLQHVPDPEIMLDYVRELGRALRPGGWAALQVSDDPAIHTPSAGRRAAAARGGGGRAPGPAPSGVAGLPRRP